MRQIYFKMITVKIVEMWRNQWWYCKWTISTPSPNSLSTPSPNSL